MKTVKGFRILVLLTIIASVMKPGSAPASEDQSARLQSLGGKAVEGIIPDFYTDFRNNPALLAGSEKTELMYRLVDYCGASLPFYQLEINGTWEQPEISNYHYLNAMDYFWERGRGKWNIALSTLWKFSREESSRPEVDYLQNDYSSRLSEIDNDAWRIDLAAAFMTGDDISFGFRAGAYGFYNMIQRQDISYRKNYYIYNAREILNRSYERNDISNSIRRTVSAYLECGIRTEEGEESFSEISFKASKVTSTSYIERNYRRLDKFYDEYSGTVYLTERYYDNELSDNYAGGNSWIFEFQGRHRTESGIVLSASGSYERCNCDLSRWNSIEDLNYDYISEDQSEIRESIYDGGEGTFDRIHGTLKAGRKVQFNGKLNLYLGISALGSHTGWNYDPVIEYRLRSREDLDSYSENASDRTSLSIDMNNLDLNLPISLEFKPAAFFTFFSAVVPEFSFEVKTERMGFPDYGILEGSGYIYDYEITTSTIRTQYLMPTGFRLNYGERLDIEVFTEGYLFYTSELHSLNMNISYRF
jgi:hypothetical protein